MMSVHFCDYVGHFGGTMLSEEKFGELALRAQRTLDADTFGRAADALLKDSVHASAVKDCICALAELFYLQENGRDTPVQKEAVGSWSRTYLCGKGVSRAAARREIEETFLSGTGLLFRGR